MDLGKDQSHLMLHQTPDPHQEKNHVPEVIGTWNLRNREQLRKRKAEAQEKQTSQWQFGEKKQKRQRTAKGNQRGRKRQQNTELQGNFPQSQVEQEMLEEALAPTEKDTELPRNVTEAFLPIVSPQRAVPEENFPAVGQESIIHQGKSPECQEIIQCHPSEIGQDMVEPEGLSPNMCQETAVAKALPSQTSEDTADLEGCSLDAYPEPDVPKGYALETYQKKS